MDNRPGSDLVYCRECGGSFTRSSWTAHAHNPGRVGCALTYCPERAAGFCVQESLALCGPHLIEHRRDGHRVQVVDGAVCRTCDGGGRVHAQEVGDDPGGEWLRCPRCFGSGYDAELTRHREREQERRQQASEARRQEAGSGEERLHHASEQTQGEEERKRRLKEELEREAGERVWRLRAERDRQQRRRSRLFLLGILIGALLIAGAAAAAYLYWPLEQPPPQTAAIAPTATPTPTPTPAFTPTPTPLPVAA
ncbi:MAG: hypothetical protein J4F32_07145, partial [Dehalococcoidia bacterium]|nr:hypothetical protein [Dehalococcoidia bacterium]